MIREFEIGDKVRVKKDLDKIHEQWIKKGGQRVGVTNEMEHFEDTIVTIKRRCDTYLNGEIRYRIHEDNSGHAWSNYMFEYLKEVNEL